MTRALEGVEGSASPPRPLFTSGKDPVPSVQEAGWAPGPVWTVAEKLAHTGIRAPDRPARSQSLYRLSYRAHTLGFEDYENWCPLGCEERGKFKKNMPRRLLSGCVLHGILCRAQILSDAANNNKCSDHGRN